METEWKSPQRGSKLSAQGIALGTKKQRGVALKGQKHSDYYIASALSGRWIETYH